MRKQKEVNTQDKIYFERKKCKKSLKFTGRYDIFNTIK